MVVNRLHLRNEPALGRDPASLLAEKGIEAVVVSSEADLDSIRLGALPHLALLDASSLSERDLSRCIHRCSLLSLPVIALVPAARVADLDVTLGINDFVVSPPHAAELLTRARQVLWRGKAPEGADSIRVGDLVINPTSYQVSLKGRRLNLRFKEYELLRLLATNPGRVYTRDALLNQIWGYEYFGGTRTVDVHIRRLRSKIEDLDHSVIQTVWNVGYRFADARR